MSLGELVKRALSRGAQWRYLLLFLALMLVPTLVAFAPIASFLGSLFDASPRAPELVARLDSATFTEVVRQLGEPAAAGIAPGATSALVLGVLLAPVAAALAAALAHGSPATLRMRDLLAEAGELLPRMIRVAFVSLLPLLLAVGVAALAFYLANKSAEHAVRYADAERGTRMATALSLLLVWLANVTAEAGRAHLVAQPTRRSAFLAWWSGVVLLLRRPGQVLAVCLATTAFGVGGGALVTALRYRLVQSGPGTILLAFLLGQLAVGLLAWARASRLVGLVEIVRDRDPGA